MSYHHSSERPEYIEQIRAEVRGVPYRPAKRKKETTPPLPPPETVRGIFIVFTGNRWLELGSRQPAAKMLFGKFWYQHELCFLFANSNAGKSILAVQIADTIARGRKKTGPFACQIPASTVLYADLELSNLQFHRRYTHQKLEYEFSDNFFRAQFNPTADISGEYDESLLAALEYRIIQLKPAVLIIDNISCLRGGVENAASALRIMSRLNFLRTEYKLSILVLAHTPKRRDNSRPVSADDLHGSKMLMNFADSAFAIGVSNNDSGLRYLKQIKQRNSMQVYGEDNVCQCRIEKPLSFVQFNFCGCDAESRLLLTPNQLQREKVIARVAELRAKGNSQRQIAVQLNISLGMVNSLINR